MSLRQLLVEDWRKALQWSSVRFNAALVGLSLLFQVMPALDPQIAHMIPEPLRNPLIGVYALANVAFRITKLKRDG